MIVTGEYDADELRVLIPHMTPGERVELERLLGPRPIWEPLPGPQSMAYYSAADELYYGGSAGGGKSDLILGLALTAHRRSIVFRREYTQLRALIDRSQQLIGTRGRYNATDKVWRELPGDRRLQFGAVQLEADKNNWQGNPHDLKAYDELPQLSRTQYTFLNAWNRTTYPGQRCRVVGAGNPPLNPEDYWVLEYWGAWLNDQHPNPARPGELRWYATIDDEDREVEDGTPFEHDGDEIVPRSRTFIPARLEDNPYYGAEYKATLQALPEPLRSQLLQGKMDAGVEDHEYQVIPTEWVMAAQARGQGMAEPEGPYTATGVDVARGGHDATVLAPRKWNWFAPLEVHPGKRTPDGPAVAALILRALASGGYANVDVIGVGASAYDHARLYSDRVYPINFAAEPWGTDRAGVLKFVNLRAYAYWSVREMLDPESGDDIALPPDPELRADLCAPRWMIRASGIQVEAKDDIAKRIGRSTDRGDAVALSALPQQVVTFGPDIWS